MLSTFRVRRTETFASPAFTIVVSPVLIVVPTGLSGPPSTDL